MAINRISVIITAHDRKQFILKAVDSVRNQKIGADKIEIIVVKNFRDDYIDGQLDQTVSRNIFSNVPSTGEKVAIGIDYCTGDVISLLDDDDEFMPEKLKIVMKEFSKPDSLSLYHNGSYKVNGKGESVCEKSVPEKDSRIFCEYSLNLKRFKELYIARSNYNISSFSISRSFALSVRDTLSRLKTNVDTALLFLAADGGCSILADSRRLTRILVHNSISRSNANRESFLTTKVDFMNRSAAALEDLKSFLGHDELRSFVDYQIWELMMLINLLELGKYKGLLKPGLIVKSLRLFPSTYIMKILVATFLARIIPKKIPVIYRRYSIQNRNW